LKNTKDINLNRMLNNIKNIFIKVSLVYKKLFIDKKSSKLMLGRWDRNLKIMDKYEGKDYPY